VTESGLWRFQYHLIAFDLPKRKSQRDAAKGKKEEAPEAPAEEETPAADSKSEKFAALKKKLAEENAAA
jgi:hypothetical protein